MDLLKQALSVAQAQQHCKPLYLREAKFGNARSVTMLTLLLTGAEKIMQTVPSAINLIS